MPRCIQCNEPFAASLRRCPHCGAASPEDPVAANADAPEFAPLDLGEGGGRKRLGRVRRVLLLAALLGAAGIGVVAAIPGAAPEPAPPADRPALKRAPNPGRTANAPEPARAPEPQVRGIKAGPVEGAVEVEAAELWGDQVVVRGRVNPNAVVRVTVDGEPLPISADGSTFQGVLPRSRTSFELLGSGVDGASTRVEVLVKVPDGDGGREFELLRRLDGQTFHHRMPAVDPVPGAEVPDSPVVLDRVETLFRAGNRVVRLYRAPEDLTFLRVTRTGHYSFLRSRDEQEVILVPGGIASRGMGEEAPHGPAHLVKLDPYLIDRTEVTGAQYATFLAYMERVDDPSLRHREDRATDLRPMGWDSTACPPDAADRPVTGVSWYGAYAYARWVGGRLPTEAQWERAAAGAEGAPYPWGDSFEAARCASGVDALRAARSLPAGAGPCDLLHAAGNAREWCTDRFDPRWLLYASRTNPLGPAGHRHRVVRGGSLRTGPDRLVLQFRDHEAPEKKIEDIGFRVAMPWPPEIR